MIATAKDQRYTIGEEGAKSWTVSGAGSEAANGVYQPAELPSYSGVQPFSNGPISLFRWQRKHWVLSDLGEGRDNFDQSRWLYAAEASGPLPPLTGWEPRNGAGPAPDVA